MRLLQKAAYIKYSKTVLSWHRCAFDVGRQDRPPLIQLEARVPQVYPFARILFKQEIPKESLLRNYKRCSRMNIRILTPPPTL